MKNKKKFFLLFLKIMVFLLNLKKKFFFSTKLKNGIKTSKT
uniref:Uncharacterized protein n=1 Tax=viral metagenome TaxID=1070528 RepID=A0A6C0ADY0_9ZZZZ